MAETENPGSPIDLVQIRTELLNMPNPVYREVVVSRTLTLSRLHTIIQRSFGWENYHRHEFLTKARRGERIPKTWRICDAAPDVKSTFYYAYDFGDDWMHKIKMLKLLGPDPAITHPTCVGGAGACPPEDCGGPGGYLRLLSILAKKSHPDYQAMFEWVGSREWDPLAFDKDMVNASLRRLKL